MSQALNIKHLETFYWIVRLGTFAAAAERLHTTQPTVSARIQELEQALGVIVFDRTHHRAKLTPKGRELVAYAERMVGMTSEILHRVGSAASLAGVVKLGVAELVAATWLPALTGTARARYPNITLDISVDVMDPLLGQLREGDLDLVLGPGPMNDQNIAWHSLGTAKFHWMAGRGIELPARELMPADLARHPIVTLCADSHVYRHIERWFEEFGEPFRFVTSCNRMEVVAELTRLGQGVSLLPRVAYEPDIAQGALRILKTRSEAYAVEFFAVLPHGRFNPLADAVCSLALEATTFAGRAKRKAPDRAA
jgi:DNA-binding transcriptional LysR family regulator